MSLSLRCKWYSLIYVFLEVLTKLVSRRKKWTVNSKKKTIISMKKIIEIVSLIFKTLSFVLENSVAVTEFSNSVMFDALKRFDFFFVDLSSKRQIFSFFVISFSLFFHRDESSFLIVFLFFELIRINRKFAHFKKKMFSKFSVFEKNIIKIATNVTQLSIVFDNLKKTMKMLKNRLFTMKKLIRNKRMLTLFSEINSERKIFVSFAEIADERVITIDSDHENQKDKFFLFFFFFYSPAKDQSYRLANIIKVISAVMLSFRDINQFSKEKLTMLTNDRNDYVFSFLQFSKEFEDSLLWSFFSTFNLKKRIFWLLFQFEKCLLHSLNIQNLCHQNKADHLLKQSWQISHLNSRFSKKFRNWLSFENKISSVCFLILCFSTLFRLISR